MSMITKMTDLEIGTIYLTTEGAKQRPVLLISDGLGLELHDTTVARITTHAPRNEFDVVLKDWKQAGLHQPSVVCCAKTSIIKMSDIGLKVGDLSNADFIEVMDKTAAYIVKSKERGLEKRAAKQNSSVI